jgi:serine/threonine protein kinase
MNQLLRPKQNFLTETSRSPLQVEQFLGGGGQGEVYRALLAGKPVALKWYFPRMATAQQRAVLDLLVRRAPPNNRFLWPLEMVTDPKVPGYGYVMGLRLPRYKGIVDLMKRRIEPSFRALLTAGYQLADSYFQLHSAGLCYRDISFGNVFFDPQTGDVLICDNDNVTVNNAQVSGVLGTPKFMAPEVVRGDAMPNSNTDLYSLAVLLFYMLCVHHPLDGKRESQIHVLDLPAMNRLYGHDPLFIFDPADDRNRPDPTYHRNAIEYWPIYPEYLRALFVESFTKGIRDPQHGRVRESQWRLALRRALDSLCYCPGCGSENFYEETPTGSPQAKRCWSCNESLPWPLRLRFNGKQVVALNHDTKLTSRQTTGDDQELVTAEVTRHPQDPTIWGLKNRSSAKWVATNPQGELSDVQPDKSIRLVAGTKLNFGQVTAEIEG